MGAFHEEDSNLVDGRKEVENNLLFYNEVDKVYVINFCVYDNDTGQTSRRI